MPDKNQKLNDAFQQGLDQLAEDGEKEENARLDAMGATPMGPKARELDEMRRFNIEHAEATGFGQSTSSIDTAPPNVATKPKVIPTAKAQRPSLKKPTPMTCEEKEAKALAHQKLLDMHKQKKLAKNQKATGRRPMETDTSVSSTGPFPSLSVSCSSTDPTMTVTGCRHVNGDFFGVYTKNGVNTLVSTCGCGHSVAQSGLVHNPSNLTIKVRRFGIPSTPFIQRDRETGKEIEIGARCAPSA